MGITRTVAGLIFQDNFERPIGAPGSNWTIRAGLWEIALAQLDSVTHGNVLRANPDAAARIEVAAAVFGAKRTEFVVQSLMRRDSLIADAGGDTRGDTVFPALRHTVTDLAVEGTDNNFQVVETNNGVWSSVELYRVLNGANLLLQRYTSGAAGPLGWIQHKISRKTAYQRAWAPVSGALQILSGTDITLADAAIAGFSCGWIAGSTGWAEFNNFSTYRNNRVRMTGMPAGHKMRLVYRYTPLNVQEDMVVVETGGVAEVELEHKLCPLVRDQIGTLTAVELLDASDVVVDSLTPADGVWGGDEYAVDPTWTAGEAPPNTAWTTGAAPPATAWSGCGAPPATTWEQC